MLKLFLILLTTFTFVLKAQFAPSVGKVGSTAIHADSNCFIDWGSAAHIFKGYKNISTPDSGFVDVGSAESACGRAKENGVVSLGDSGIAIVQFFNAIIDGPGFDFAIFENAFNDTFLELAHVEISNDGINYFKFPSFSLTQINTQLGPFNGIKAEKIHNLAGKYRSPYGTPFDISDLDTIYQNIPKEFYFVRITDVVGSINPKWATTDHYKNIINDPWPTPFISSGFDLDAVGMINGMITSSTNLNKTPNIYFITKDGNTLIKSQQICTFSLYNNTGQLVQIIQLDSNSDFIQIPQINTGLYYWKTEFSSGCLFIE